MAWADGRTLYSNEFGDDDWEVTTAPEGSLWLVTNNTDGVGDPDEVDDLILRLGGP